MNLIDVLILIWLVSAVLRGYAVGLIRQALSFVGFFIGLSLAAWLVPQLLGGFEGPSRLPIALFTILIIAALFAGTGEGLGVRLQRLLKVRIAHVANAVLGAVIGVLFVLFFSWLIATSAARLPLAGLSLAFERSAIVQLMGKFFPAAPDLTERLGQLLTPYGLPQVFVGPEPEPDPTGPPSTPEVEAAAAQAAGSTVRIEGFACGGISTGSGYVASSQYVVTNAHVVAGVTAPIVFNQNERQRGTVVWFDPSLDLAVIKTERALPGKPLELQSALQERGTSVAVLGYPGGGPFKVSPGVVLRSQLAIGRDIYGQALSSREVYVLQADVAPGNSGGPVVTADGRVAGLIFGEAVTRDGFGYAITSRAFAESLQTALARSTPVTSGACMQ